MLCCSGVTLTQTGVLRFLRLLLYHSDFGGPPVQTEAETAAASEIQSSVPAFRECMENSIYFKWGENTGSRAAGLMALCVGGDKAQTVRKRPEGELGVHLLPQTHSRNWLGGITKKN